MADDRARVGRGQEHDHARDLVGGDDPLDGEVLSDLPSAAYSSAATFVSDATAPENDNADEMLELVAAGTAVCFGPTSMAEYHRHPGLVWLPITDVEPLRIVLAWSHESVNPLAGEFVRVVRDLVHADGRGQ